MTTFLVVLFLVAINGLFLWAQLNDSWRSERDDR